MKTKLTNWTTLALVTVCCVIFSCTNQDKQKDLALAKAEAIIRADSIMWSNLFDPDEKSTKAIFDCPVDQKFANMCIEGYKKWYSKLESLDSATIHDVYTEEVAFKGKSLKRWIRAVGGVKKGVEIRISFGIYTEEAVNYAMQKEYPSEVSLDTLRKRPRLTVILRAYKNNELLRVGSKKRILKAYNLGSLKP